MRKATFTTLVAPAIATLLLAGAAAPAQGGKKKFRKPQDRPIQLGTSGGNVRDFEIDPPFISCSSGTLGALLEMDDDGEIRQFVLSNNHVIGLNNKARKGDEIVQPGLIDTECDSAPEDVIATFTARKRIKFKQNKLNDVDMAIAEVVDGAVRADGKILRIGVPGNGTVAAFPLQKVKKSGRTSGFTRGQVFLIDADVPVDFSSTGAQSQTARFRDQILVENSGRRSFSQGGDSGSMVYEDVKKCPRAVGLLFAGNDAVTVLNPIDKVLATAKKLKPKGEKTLVGCDSAAAPLAVRSAREEREIAGARRAKERFVDRAFEIEGVVGIGVGTERPDPKSAAERAVIRVLVERDDLESIGEIPTELDGVPVRVTVTGRFKAF